MALLWDWGRIHGIWKWIIPWISWISGQSLHCIAFAACRNVRKMHPFFRAKNARLLLLHLECVSVFTQRLLLWERSTKNSFEFLLRLNVSYEYWSHDEHQQLILLFEHKCIKESPNLHDFNLFIYLLTFYIPEQTKIKQPPTLPNCSQTIYFTINFIKKSNPKDIYKKMKIS